MIPLLSGLVLLAAGPPSVAPPPTPDARPAPIVVPDPPLGRLLSLPPGYAALEVEAAVGVDTGPARSALDRVVDRARRDRRRWRTTEDALRSVAAATAGVCTRVQAGDADQLYSDALAAGVCDCDVLVVTYLTVADELDLPLQAAFLPGHVLVTWDDGAERRYWETTDGSARPAWSIEALVPEGADGAYLRPQSRAEILGHLVGVRATYRHHRGDWEGASADYDLAARLNPTYALTFSNRGRARLLAEAWDGAVDDFGRALALDPTLGDARYGRAVAHLGAGRPRAAVPDFDRVIRQEGAPDAYYGRGVARAALGDDEGAREDFAAALGGGDPHVLAHFQLGKLYERGGDVARARASYAAFLAAALGPGYDVETDEARRRLAHLGQPPGR